VKRAICLPIFCYNKIEHLEIRVAYVNKDQCSLAVLPAAQPCLGSILNACAEGDRTRLGSQAAINKPAGQAPRKAAQPPRKSLEARPSYRWRR